MIGNRSLASAMHSARIALAEGVRAAGHRGEPTLAQQVEMLECGLTDQVCIVARTTSIRDIQWSLATHPNPRVRRNVALNMDAYEDVLDRLLDIEGRWTSRLATVLRLPGHDYALTLYHVSRNRNVSTVTLLRLHDGDGVPKCVASDIARRRLSRLPWMDIPPTSECAESSQIKSTEVQGAR